jgi:predicted RNA-binding Zn ribbon-like protein
MKQRAGQRHGKGYLFIANHPCLDFVNTELVLQGTLTDLLETFEDLLAWLVESRQLRKQDAEGVSRQLTPDEKADVLEQAKTFRATMRSLAQHIVSGSGVPKSAVASINKLLWPCAGFRELVSTGSDTFQQVFVPSADGKDALLASLAVFASDLLCSADLRLIKKCKNPACVLYFYDTTKNHARSWCSMQLCGNRDKVAAYFKRKRKKDK